MGRPKRRKPLRIDDDDDDDEEEDEVVAGDTASPPPKKCVIRSTIEFKKDEEEDDDNGNDKKPAAKNDGRVKYLGDYHVPENQEEYENDVPFCCAICKCPDERKNRVVNNQNNEWVIPGENNYWHRRCCHFVFEEPNDSKWAPPYENAVQQAQALIWDETFKPPSEFEYVFKKQIKEAYKNTYAQLAKHNNADSEPAPGYIAWTHKDFPLSVKWYEDIVKERKNVSTRKAAVVLDCFAGAGTAVVCLKKNNIAIAKIIHVEHDKVCTHVYRYNHDHNYNDNLDDDGIKHHFIEKFEELEENVNMLVNEHGPIDIITGGPPCIDFSPINANRRGVQGSQGNYMVRFGIFIRKIEKCQYPHPVFFLAENVVTRGNDREQIRKAFEQDWDPIKMNAACVSPCLREREFYSNIPPKWNTIDFEGGAALSSPTACIESGLKVPAQLLHPGLPAKVHCFMASKSRIDNPSKLCMYVFGNQDPITKKYVGRPLNGNERENLMGFPKGYVEKPVYLLFLEIRDKAMKHSVYKLEKHWQNELPPKYHHFAGQYHGVFPDQESFQLEVLQSEVPGCRERGEYQGVEAVGIKMAPPMGSHARPSFFSASEYANHIIGNAFSVPVVTALLKPLKDLFQTKVYKDFCYDYAWQNEKPVNDMQPLVLKKSK